MPEPVPEQRTAAQGELGAVEGSEAVGGMAEPELGLESLAELEVRMMKNHLQSLMLLVDLQDLVSIARGLFGVRHLQLLVVFGTGPLAFCSGTCLINKTYPILGDRLWLIKGHV